MEVGEQPVTVEVKEMELTNLSSISGGDSGDEHLLQALHEEGMAETRMPLPRIITQGLKIKVKHQSDQSFSYAPFPGTEMSLPVDWQLLVANDIEGQNIRCHQLQGDEQLSPLFDSFMNKYSQAVVLINTSNDYNLAPKLISGVEKLHFPVVVVYKSDGDKILRCLEQQENVTEDVYAKIDAENAVDNVDMAGRGAISLEQQDISGSVTSIRPTAMEGNTRWQQFKRVFGASPKFVADFKLDIMNFMFSSDKTPITVVNGQEKFIFIMSAFHNSEKMAELENYSELSSAVLKNLDTHMDKLFSVDLPFYIAILYRMYKKQKIYMREDIAPFIVNFIDKVEKADSKVVTRALTNFSCRDDFKVTFNPDGTEEKHTGIFALLQCACLEMAKISYTTQTRLNENASNLPNGLRPLYKNFLYSRMLWVSMAMKLVEVCGGHTTRSTRDPWNNMFLRYYKRVVINYDTITELEKGLKVYQLLQLPSELTCSLTHLISHLVIHGDEALRPFSELTECFEMLKKFVQPSGELKKMLDQLRAVYEQHLSKPSSKKLTSASIKGTLTGCITEGIEFLDTLFDLCSKQGVTKDYVDSEVSAWMKLLLQLIDIAGDDPAFHLKYFISGKEKVIKEYRSVAEKYIVGVTQEKQLSIHQFFHLYNSFKIWSNQFVQEFLQKYDIPLDITLSDTTWKDFFRLVQSRFNNASHHFYLADFMIACSRKYKESHRSAEFITDLLKLDVKNLLSVEKGKVHKKEDRKRSKEVRDTFADFLCEYINSNDLKIGILGNMDKLLTSISNGHDEFQMLVLDVLCHEVVPELRTLQGKEVDVNIKESMLEIMHYLMVNFSWHSVLSTKQEFCWRMLATCCSKMVVSKDSLDGVLNYCSFMMSLDAGRVYRNYCTHKNKKLSSADCIIITNLPHDVKTHHSEDLQR